MIEIKPMLELPVARFPFLLPERTRAFEDRREAGQKLAAALEPFRRFDPVVLAIPPGGIEVGLEIARILGAEFSPIVSEALFAPDGHREPLGAIAEDGSSYLHVDAVRSLGPQLLGAIKHDKLVEIQGTVGRLRHGRDLPGLAGRTVILVDDGLVSGATMKAALLLCRKRYPACNVVAVPVSGDKALKEIQWLADETVVLARPGIYYDGAQVYRSWSVPSPDAMAGMLRRWEYDRRPLLPAKAAG